MKKLLSIALSLLLVYGCSNEFELTENWKDVTVVYGLLNTTDSIQYIRIEKAFLDKTTNALVLAQEADSLYYNSLNVELEEIVSGSTGSIISLTRVDANLEGFQREDGIFATSPNYVYKTAEPINSNARYRLLINKNDGDQVTAETAIVPDFTITAPLESITDLSFRINNDNTVTRFRWTLEPNSKFFEFGIRIHYKEALVSDPTNFTTKSIKWMIDDNLVPEQNASLVRVEIPSVKFHAFLASSLEEGYVREFISMDMEIGAGASDLLEYINRGLTNAGVTGADAIPVYTNVLGSEENAGLGILSSRIFKTRTGFGIDGITLDSLKEGYRTNNLGF